MKQKPLLLILSIIVLNSVNAQQGSNGNATEGKAKSGNTITGYAITAAEKGGRSWKEVRMVDISSGNELRSVYESKSDQQALNARTGKPVQKKEPDPGSETVKILSYTPPTTAVPGLEMHRKVVNLDEVLDKNVNTNVNTNVRTYTRVFVSRQPVQTDKPFATSSAAMGYDKKHDRLYYTPMFINQLRYIDLKSGKIYFFEDEAFGSAGLHGNQGSQITRMAFGSDGNGYALSNDANQLIRFTTGKKPVITDLGAIADDAADERTSIHSPAMYGGDMIADADGNLYLISANRRVFKISIENKSAKYLGNIKGLPQGFSTNGAMVEEGSKVIIASSESTAGYYRFDLNTLQAEKVSESADVFNASDLANGNLAFDKKKKEKEEQPVAENKPVVTDNATAKGTEPADEGGVKQGISIYPNPVTNGVVRLSFADQPSGRYQVQLLDLSGRLIGAREVNISNVKQTEEFRFPELSVKGNYLIRVSSEVNKVNVTEKVVVQ